MEHKNEMKYTIGSIVCGLLTVFGIVANIISLVSGGGTDGMFIAADCAGILLFVAIAYYAFTGYKKPHGNKLKYIILIRAALTLVIVYNIKVQSGDTCQIILLVCEIGLMSYIAGRLNKVKENTVLMLIVAACQLIPITEIVSSGVADIGVASGLIGWVDICVAYLLRYKQHREAGLEDAPKK